MVNGKRRINLNKRVISVIKGVAVYVLIAFAALMFFYQVSGTPTSSNDVPISQIIKDVKEGKVTRISLEGDKVVAEIKDSDQKLSSRKEQGESIYKILESSGVDPKGVIIEIRDLSLQQAWVGILSAILPILLLVGLMFLLFRNAKEGAQGIFSFAQSRARLFTKDQPQIKFSDVAGAEEAKKELVEVVEFLKTPDKFKVLGARIPKGVLLIGPAGTGKCVTGDTIIWTNKGLMEIREVPRYFYVDPKSHQVYGSELPGFNIDDVVSSKNFASHWFNLGEQETVKVKLAQGFILEGTPEHPVVVMDSDGKLCFRNIQYLQEGDHVAIQFGRRIFGNLDLVDEDTAYLLGLLTGDGNLSHASTVGLTSIEPEIIEFYKKYLRSHYPKGTISTSINGQSFLISNWDFKRQLYQLGMSYLLSFDKVIPPTILQAPKQVQTAFLQGLFDTDASIGKTRAEFEYTTVSEKMVRQVQMMLLNLGIVASLNLKGRTENGYYRPVYRLTMTGFSLVNFGSTIGFRLSRKQKLLKGHVKKMDRVNTNIDIIPGISYLVAESWREISKNKLSNNKLSKTIDKVRRRGRVSRQTLSEYVSCADSLDFDVPHLEYLRSILEAQLFFSKVIEKTSGRAKVYDFTVPQTHSFLGNGFVNHNTLISRAVAGEAGVPFYSIAGSEFMEMLVGVGAARVRDMFATAKKSAPAIIFVDEIESIGRQRGIGITGGHDEREQTLNQILVEMDGFTPNDRVIVIAASVTGDTPILIKDRGVSKLMPIGEFIGQYYKEGEEGVEKFVDGIETLGFEKRKLISKDHRLYFQNSAFKKVRSVFRHRIKEIYQITYLGGKVKSTGNHSVFVRTNQGILPKKVCELKKGDILVNLPIKVNRTNKYLTEVRAHKFSQDFNLTLPVYQNREIDEQWQERYLFAQTNYGELSQSQIGTLIGVAQTTVGNWLRGVFLPRAISKNYFNHNLPENVIVTPELCRLLGYYTAEGYSRKGVDFCFNEQEKHLISDLKMLMRTIFRLEPDRERHITDNAINIIYYSTPVGLFFAQHVGKGAGSKCVPRFLFETPREYFIEFLKGVLSGDGYVDKRGRGEITSISKQLILELNWLCRMHGIKSYINSFTTKEGRRIKNGKPLKATIAYRLGFGKYNNPFLQGLQGKHNPIKRPIVQSVDKMPFDDYVYDLCGIENEAFFGGESPILLHNTNRPDLLDAALVRPGRFDRRVALTLPDLIERRAIIELHMKGKPFTKEVSTEKLARRTVGFSGADLANMLNEAAILAAREGKVAIDNKDLEEAATKEKLGPQRKRMQSETDRKLAAYHEAGHAIVGHFLKNVDPVHRISIVARGMSGGHTMFPPTEDRSNETKSRLLEQITAALGGQAAEEMVFKDISTGAASDISVATQIVRQMVMEYGMSSLGPITLQPKSMFGIWRGMDDSGEMSPELHNSVDKEIKKIIDLSFKQALSILRLHKAKLDAVAKALLEKETLESEEFEKIVGKKKS